MKKVEVFKDFTAEERMTRIGGERLRHLVLKLAANDQRVTIHFDGKAVASVSFLDEGLAKLILEGWSLKKFKQLVELSEMHPRDKRILDDLLAERSRKV